MKSLTLLWNQLAEEMASRCCTSATMDIKTVQGRVEHEGLSFFTITLPTFGKDFQKSLDQGFADRNSFQGFSWRAGLPSFLRGFLDRVFDTGTGVLLNDPDIEAILAVRQLTLFYSKVLLPCTSKREKDAMSGYVQCDREVKEHDASMIPADYDRFHSMSSVLFRSILTKLDRMIYLEEIVPKHGPGATADGLIGNEKLTQSTWTVRLQEVFSYENFLFPNAKFALDRDVTFLEPGSELPSRVISVPKTQKTPRIIAIEPTCMQYMQQAVLEQLILAIEGDSLLNSLLGFSDQTPNQRMAQSGSDDGSLASLDLSEASDRVSNQLVRTMLRNHPNLLRAIEASRSRKADVPGHGVIRLAKFASMGSALCFPIEAMVFLTLVLMGIQEHSTQCGSRFSVRSMRNQVRIYGDDIISPSDSALSVISMLESFGIRVNRSKSYWTGRFRESCGKEFYAGHDVSIVKFRRLFPTSLADAQECISIVSLRNQLYLAGCWRVVRYVDSKIRKVFKYFPVVEESSPALGRISFLPYKGEKVCNLLHRPLVKGYVVRSIIPRSNLDGDGALLKYFLKRGAHASADERHLERSGRPRAVDIKPRWVTPY